MVWVRRWWWSIQTVCGVPWESLWGPVFTSDWSRQCGALLSCLQVTQEWGDDQGVAWGKGWCSGIPRKQEEWYIKNVKMFSRDKCQVLHLEGRGPGRDISWYLGEQLCRKGSEAAGRQLPDNEGSWPRASWAVSPDTQPADQGKRLSSLCITLRYITSSFKFLIKENCW